MLRQAVDYTTAEALPLQHQEIPGQIETPEALLPLDTLETTPSLPIAKDAVRTSLQASTLDGVFATVFSNVAGGVLLSNLLVELHASPLEIGLLSSIPMLVNLLQPLGAYLSNRSTSRHFYCLWIYIPSRLLWLALILGVMLVSWHKMEPHLLVPLALAIVVLSNVLGALGSASWLSWLAALVPPRLRGRYFGFRNSAASLTSLISLPLLGLLVSHYPGGTLEGYGVALGFGLIAGLVSLGFQNFMIDVNPQEQKSVLPQRKRVEAELTEPQSDSTDKTARTTIWQDANFLVFLLYFAFLGFATNLSSPFFNLYLLDNLSLDVSWVTLYNSLAAGANLLLLMFWGKLADRIGNRPILLVIGIVVAVIPLFWLGVGHNPLSIWLWLPLLHISMSGAWAAIDLCNNNIQMEIAPSHHHSTYFAIAAAVAGVSGAFGTTVGGLLAEYADYGGVPGLFALSSVLRLLAVLPLIFVREKRGRSLRRTIYTLLPFRSRFAPVKVMVGEQSQE
jgi:MFS family permease